MTTKLPISIIGCGFVGKLIARRLLCEQVPVTGYVSSDSSLAECNSRKIACEIIDLDRTLPELNVAGKAVIYLVPPPGKGKLDTRIKNFFAAIEKHKPEKLVLLSTTGVYGDCNGEWIDETRPLNPAADRAYRRVNAELQAEEFCQRNNIPLVILRVAGIYGPGKIPIKRIKSGEPIVNLQDSPFTNRIHVEDLVRVCEEALMNNGITGIFNATDGHPGTMFEYFTGVAMALGLPAPPAISLEEAKQQLSAGMLSYMAESRRINNAKLLRDFGLELRYPDLEHGLGSLRLDE